MTKLPILYFEVLQMELHMKHGTKKQAENTLNHAVSYGHEVHIYHLSQFESFVS